MTRGERGRRGADILGFDVRRATRPIPAPPFSTSPPSPPDLAPTCAIRRRWRIELRCSGTDGVNVKYGSECRIDYSDGT
ncbi:hypothetical protein VPH35_052871 [Triticum aestivum]